MLNLGEFRLIEYQQVSRLDEEKNEIFAWEAAAVTLKGRYNELRLVVNDREAADWLKTQWMTWLASTSPDKDYPVVHLALR